MGWSRRKQKIHMLISRHFNAAQNCNIKIASNFFANVAKLRYLATTLRKKDDLITLVTKIRGIHRQRVSCRLFFIIREVKVRKVKSQCLPN
jgi:hypothetical protein